MNDTGLPPYPAHSIICQDRSGLYYINP